jgi:peptidoglycan-associated lipoprotein
MFQDRQSLFLTWGALALISLSGLVSCGSPVSTGNFPARKWTNVVNNPLSGSAGSDKVGQGQSQTASRETPVDSGGSGSLDQLRRGESSATPASSPLKDVYFAFDRDDLDTAARETLRVNADWLYNNPSATVQIEGHCDERGTNEYNLALGARRAGGSKDYLVNLGVSADRLSTISYGKEIPACKESTEECWAKNRRARFVIMRGSPPS